MHGNFTWDLGKEARNLQKHGVDFATAALVFMDPCRGIVFDDKHSHYEDRYFCIGEVNGRVLSVRFVYRENHIRILGAGYWRKGARYYEKKNNR